jgi:hypothetical protein
MIVPTATIKWFLARLSFRVAARSTSLMEMRRCLSSGSTQCRPSSEATTATAERVEPSLRTMAKIRGSDSEGVESAEGEEAAPAAGHL